MLVILCVLRIDNPGEMCFVIEEESTDVTEKLNVMKEILVATEACKPKLDRSLRVCIIALRFIN